MYPLLCYDVFFKSVFSDNENLLAKMISDITGIDYELLKDNIILETNELPISNNNEKAKRCDFIIRINKDNIINLELNRQSYTGLVIKNLSYLFHLFASSSRKGNEYNENLVITQININCFKDNNFDTLKPLCKYNLREENTNKLYVKNVVIYELNVVKCHELYYNKDTNKKLPNYVLWGALIYCNNIENVPDILKSFLTKKEFDYIMDKLDKLTREDLFYSEEEALEWAEWERRSIETEIRKKSTEEGLKQGIEQGIEQNTKDMIISMKKNNVTLDLISKVTNKSIKEIEEILNNN